MANEEIQNLLRTAIQAAQSGNKAIARRILEQVVEQDPANEVAWLWMTSVVDSVDERRACLEKVLAVNPNNERAKQAFDKLPRAAPAPPSARPSPVPDQPARRPTASRPTAAVREPDRISRPARTATPPPSAVADRAALLAGVETPGRRRGRSRLVFALLFLIAVGIIGAGAVLWLMEQQSEEHEEEPTLTPVSTQVAQATITPTPTRFSMGGSPTPLGGTLTTLSSFDSLPPTWTPTATWTPAAQPTATLVPLTLVDNTLLVAVTREDNRRLTLYTMLADGSNEAPLPLEIAPPGSESGPEGDVSEASTLEENATPSAQPRVRLVETFGASYSTGGEQVVFTARFDTGRTYENSDIPIEFDELFIAPADGGPAQQITTLGALHTENADWSPDGSQIVFASDIDGDFEIYITNLDGTTPTKLTNNDYIDRYPTWSPDGHYIAFASELNSPGFLEIWRMRVDGAEMTQLTNDTNNSYAPVWSPDGNLIAFLSDRHVDTDLYVMNADGSGERLITVDDQEYEDREACWSPDSQWIVFSSRRDSLVFELYVVRADGSNLQRLTENRGDNRYPVWKP